MTTEIKTVLKEKELKKFEALKNYHGLTTSSLLRFLIVKVYRETREAMGKAQLNKSVKPSEKEVSQNA